MFKMEAWQISNNMSFNTSKFQLLRLGSNTSIKNETILFTDNLNEVLIPTTNIKDLGIIVDDQGDFKLQRQQAILKAKRKANWVLRTFSTRREDIMVTLWKSLIQPHIDYCSQVWYPADDIGDIKDVEQVLKAYTKKIAGCKGLNYWQRLIKLGIFSTQRRMERYKIIYVWKMINGIVPDFGMIKTKYNERMGLMAEVPSITSYQNKARSLMMGSMRYEGPKLFNSTPRYVREFVGSVDKFKKYLDGFLEAIPDEPAGNNMTPTALSYSSRPSNSIKVWVKYLRIYDYNKPIYKDNEDEEDADRDLDKN